MIDRQKALDLEGATVVDQEGDKIGTVADVYLDKDTQEPEWIVVRTGLFGTRSSFVPLKEASLQGKDVEVPYDKDKVKNAPNIERGEELSPEQERELYSYYGIPYEQPTIGRDRESAADDPTAPVRGVRLVRYVIITRS
jgi:sporulation protein YlmC with PRC-barrel domain